ncbi:hypothetical protein [Ferdinandcohnia sp. Marseille-Q9671]
MENELDFQLLFSFSWILRMLYLVILLKCIRKPHLRMHLSIFDEETIRKWKIMENELDFQLLFSFSWILRMLYLVIL